MRDLLLISLLLSGLMGCAIGSRDSVGPDDPMTSEPDGPGDGSDTEPPRPMRDAGEDALMPDVEDPDAGRSDAGTSDAGTSDAGTSDAERTDTGTLTPDECITDSDCADDGLACTAASICASGMCVPPAPTDCNDGIACTNDSCSEPIGTCRHVPDDAHCPRGELCDLSRGCVTAPDCVSDGDCDDHLACNGRETCRGGSCSSGAPVVCDDGISCTFDACLEPTGLCSNVTPTERCNGLDDDCDGIIDDGFTCAAGSTSACTTTCGTSGTRSCNGSCSGYGSCVSAEVCNGCDDDADGDVDEGAGCTASPANDTCAGATVLVGDGRRSDTLAGANLDATLGGGMCGNGVEVFYRVDLARKSLVYLDTFGTTFDTLISYRGTTCPGAARPPQCEDDQCGGLSSQLVRQLNPGAHYFAVHSLSLASAAGAFTLNYQVAPAGGALNVNVTGRATYAHTTSGGSNFMTASCGGGATGPESMYWWTQCPGQTRAVSMNTCMDASFDTAMHLWGPTGELACNDDYGGCGASGRSSLVFHSTSGPGLYRMYIDGFAGASGTYTLDVSSF